ncbi:hypothetical protein [Alkaliphilus transvaalensis]|uniref:hypothetical protein n=1 Tax=Alkaliphilus transvaalensis TaxID=114628 RepID=UPI0024187B4F|nr:hypothetical protein [Alkaliphilus transvaalensis]
MKIISVRENLEYKDIAIQYFQKKWGRKNTKIIYEDCISNCIFNKKSVASLVFIIK